VTVQSVNHFFYRNTCAIQKKYDSFKSTSLMVKLVKSVEFAFTSAYSLRSAHFCL